MAVVDAWNRPNEFWACIHGLYDLYEVGHSPDSDMPLKRHIIICALSSVFDWDSARAEWEGLPPREVERDSHVLHPDHVQCICSKSENIKDVWFIRNRVTHHVAQVGRDCYKHITGTSPMDVPTETPPPRRPRIIRDEDDDEEQTLPDEISVLNLPARFSNRSQDIQALAYRWSRVCIQARVPRVNLKALPTQDFMVVVYLEEQINATRKLTEGFSRTHWTLVLQN